MKWIFYTLVLANLVYLGYQLTSGEAPRITELHAEESQATIQLLSESGVRTDRQIEAEQVLKNPISFDMQAAGSGCLGLGPFEDIVSAMDAAERLNATGFAVQVRAIDTATGDFDYRVVLPPTGSLQEAFRRLRELKSRDIDSYVISQGDDALGISLGVFSTSVAAEQHQSDLSEDGYESVIQEIPRVLRGYWILGVDDGNFPESQLNLIREQVATVGLRETACLN